LLGNPQVFSLLGMWRNELGNLISLPKSPCKRDLCGWTLYVSTYYLPSSFSPNPFSQIQTWRRTMQVNCVDHANMMLLPICQNPLNVPSHNPKELKCAPAISLGQKLVKNPGRHRNSLLAANEVSQHAPKGPSFFCILKGDGVLDFLDFCCSHQVLTVFLSSSQWVPSIFPKFSMCSSTCS